MAALGEAARLHFVFGQDIVYTYGPLGYLAVNAALPATYAAKTAAAVIIAALLASALVTRASSEGGSWQKVAFALGGVVAVGMVVQTTTIDMLLYFIVALMLTHPAIVRKAPNSYSVMALGVFAGVAGLVKFSYCVGFFVAGAAALLALMDAEALATYVIAFVLASAGVYASATFGLWPAIVPLAPGVAALALRLRFGVAVLVVAAVCAAILAANAPYLHFIVRSFKEASEYSAGMAADGSPGALAAGLTVVASIAALAVRERAALGPSRVLAIVLLLGLIFKEGFVRQDAGHLAVFFCGAALLCCIVLLSARLRYSAIAASLVAAFALFLSVRLLVSVGISNPVARVLPVTVAVTLRDELSTALDWRHQALAFQQSYAVALAPDDLAAGVVEKLRAYCVDLVGSETNVVFANGLCWSPEPVFQSRNAYAPSLDALDRDSLRSSPSWRKLVEFYQIDGRYPLGDEPFTMRAILCSDELDPQFAQPIVTSSGTDAFLVLKPSAVRCGSESAVSAGSAEWNEPIAVGARRDSIAFINVRIRYSPAGLALKALYRVPPVNMTVDYADGTDQTFRIIPAVALDGLLVDPAPKTLQSFRSLLAGMPADRAKTVRFSTDAPWVFSGVDYRVTTVSYAKP